ncbi:O-antigen polysaccharide polymerase Wzy [Weissella paramesenteroides]
MRVQIKKLISFMAQVTLLILSFIILSKQGDFYSQLSFSDISRYGTLISVVLWVANIWITGSFFSNISFIFLSFVLFQFGIPILYATSNDYINWYMSLFTDDVMRLGATFTIYSIQLFSLGIIVSSIFSRQKRTLIFSNKLWVQDDQLVEQAGLVLFLISALIYFPATLYGAFILHDRFSMPAIGGLAKQLYFPACFLLLVYTKKKSLRFFIYIMFFAESIAGMMTGGRTEGLLPIMVFIVYFFEYRDTSNEKNLSQSKNIKKFNPFKIVGILVLLSIVLILLVYIAQVRVGENIPTGEFLSQNIYQLFVGELGFNFTTIQFVMTGIGNIGFQYGLTYLSDLITLIPNALDPTGIVAHFQHISGSYWLQETYGNQLGFGLGFSLIGEAYFNFGQYGMWVLFIFGIIVERLQSKKPAESNNWEKYLTLVILLGMLTVPRRDFYQFIKQVEYSVFFVALYLYLFSKLKNKLK